MKYLKRLVLHNFQSHAHTEVNFAEGLNVIVGDNDKGKTAIIRALKWVFYNEPKGDSFVRYGADDCYVTAEMSDGCVITRQRVKAKNVYIVQSPDGGQQVFDGFGSDIPDEVLIATGVMKVKVDQDQELKLNLGEQLEPPFLVGQPGSTKAKAIGSIINTHILDAAERDLQRDITRAEAEVKSLESQISLTTDNLKRFSGIEEKETVMAEVEETAEQLRVVNSRIQQLTALQARHNANTAQQAESQRTIAALEGVAEAKMRLAKLEEISQSLSKLRILKSRRDLVEREASTATATLSSIPNLEPIRQDIKRLEDIALMGKTLVQKRNDFRNVVRSIASENTKLQQLSVLPKLVASLRELEDVLKLTGEVVPLKQKWDSVGREIQRGLAARNETVRDHTKAVAQYAAILKQLGKCPTCFKPITEDEVEHIMSDLKGAD